MTRMSKGPETKFKEFIRPFLKTLKNSWFCKVQQITISGTPDFLLCVSGTFVALELKKDASSKPTELQLYMLRKIRESGGIALVCFPENWDIVSHYLQKLANQGLTKKEIEVLHATNHLSGNV